MGMTATSGPGISLKSEAMGLAVMVELPLVVADIQRAGPSTGMPTKTEQADLLQVLFGRNSDSPMPVVAPATPADCFDVAIEAWRIALTYMTPVVYLSDAFLATGSEPWRLPDVDDLPAIRVANATDRATFHPYDRDLVTLARPWAVPGTPGLEHRIGGLEKSDITGNVSYDPDNHHRMQLLRAEKVARIADSIPDLVPFGVDHGELLIIGWGSTYGAIRSATERLLAEGQSVAHVHIRHLNPFPSNLGRGPRALRQGPRAGDQPWPAPDAPAGALPRRRGRLRPRSRQALPHRGDPRAGRTAAGRPMIELTRKDFVSDQEVRWCPGCGDYSILAQTQKVMPDFGYAKENIVFISGIGCSGRLPYYMNTYGFHTIHGRAPTLATGLKAARPDLMVWVITGDGDALSIGGNHVIHAMRRNVDVKLVMFNNRIYGLTKGQASPTSELGKRTKSTPDGTIDRPVMPLSLALAAEATFVARSVDTHTEHLQATLTRAGFHRGSSFVEVLQNCNIFNDGAFRDFTDREVREDRMLVLEHGKPMVFGKDRTKGIRLQRPPSRGRPTRRRRHGGRPPRPRRAGR